jgi:hypothetical protein
MGSTMALVFVAATACGAGSTKLLGAPVHQPIALVFTTTPEVAAKADRRGMRVMAQDLVDGIKAKGLSAYLPVGEQPAPPPRLDCFIKRWDAIGGRRLGASSYGGELILGVFAAPVAAAHARDVEVECSVIREGEAVPADRYLFTGETGNAVARDILDRIFTDEPLMRRNPSEADAGTALH